MAGMFKFSTNQDSLFVIYDHDANRPIGTGFCFLKPEWVVTAKHVAIDAGLRRENLSLLSFTGEPLRARSFFEHPNHDLAVLRIEGQSRRDVPLFPSYERYTGEKGLIYCGWAPSLNHQGRRPYSLLAAPVQSYEREQRTRDAGDESLIVFDAPSMELGHSGGPVFGEGGGVVAVIIDRIATDNEGVRARATSILHLLRFLSFPAS
jgi:hypothetical protein